MLTVHKLGVPALLQKNVSKTNTNAMESLNSTAAGYVRRIRKWRDGEMILRHMAAAFSEAENGLRRLKDIGRCPCSKHPCGMFALTVEGPREHRKRLLKKELCGCT